MATSRRECRRSQGRHGIGRTCGHRTHCAAIFLPAATVTARAGGFRDWRDQRIAPGPALSGPANRLVLRSIAADVEAKNQILIAQVQLPIGDNGMRPIASLRLLLE